MKKNYLLAGILVMLLIFGITIIGCNDGGDDPKTVTYTGTANGVTYTLKITQNVDSRSVYSPVAGDRYELTVGEKKSNGILVSFEGGILTLRPSNTQIVTFTVTVSGNSISNLSGTITWTDNTTGTGPGAMTGGSGAGEYQIYLMENPSIAFTKNGTVYCEWVEFVLGSITNGKLTLNLPESISDDKLETPYFFSEPSITVSPPDIKTSSWDFNDGFVVIDNDDGFNHLFNAKVMDGSFDYFFYLYSNKAASVTGTSWGITCDLNLQPGWNKIWVHEDWVHEDEGDNTTILKSNLSGMPTDLKWLIHIGG